MLSVRIRLHRSGFELEADFALEGPAASLLGASGAGKTTLLHAIAGHLRPDEGEIRLNERRLFSSRDRVDLPPERRGIGLVYQDGLLFPHLSVRRNLLYGWRRRAGREKEIAPDRIIGLLRLGELLERKPAKLSGGERQRVALGRALLAGPDLLLLDEPLAALDLALRRRILPYLVAVKEELDIPMLYVTHRVSEALEIADRVVVLENGRVVGRGAVQDALADPRVFAAARSLGLENVIEAEVVMADEPGGTLRVRAGGAELRVPPASLAPGRRVFATVRADEILLSESAPAGLSARNVLPAEVEFLHEAGGSVLVRVDAGFPLTVEVTPEAARDLGLAPGRPIFVVLKTHCLRVIPISPE